jgi:hypothetical protein
MYTEDDKQQFDVLREKFLAQALQKPQPKQGLSRDALAARRYLADVIRKIEMGMEYVVPDEIFSLIHLLTKQVALDMVIVDKEDRILFVDRDDLWFCGFELVGGYAHMYERNCGEWCRRLAVREIGANVKLLGFSGVHLWQLGEHAHGVPVSIIAVCRLLDKPTKNKDKIRFYRGVPRRMVPNHGRFVRITMHALRTGRLVPEI